MTLRALHNPSGWIHVPHLSTPNAQVFSKNMGYGHVLGVHQLSRGAEWFFYDHWKTAMLGKSGNLSEAMRHAEDAYRQWMRGKPRALFNPKQTKSGWTWTPHHVYRNVWHGNHREFAALVEKPWGGYWEWRVWKVRTAKEIASGLDETKQEAFRDVEKAVRKRTRFLFNEKSKWKNLGAGEYGRSFHGFHLRVIYGRVFQRYNWSIYWHGGTSAVATGHSDSFPDAKKAAEEAALSRRTLFNSRRESRSPVTKVLSIWTYRYGLSGIRRRDPHRDSIDFADEFDLTTHEMLKLEIAMREAIEKLRYPTKPRLGGHRTLFNAGDWIDRGSMGHQRTFPDHGLAVVEKMRAPQRGWTWRVYTWMAGHTRMRLPDLYGPVKAGWAKVINKAKKDAEKAYHSVTHKHPRTLFNPTQEMLRHGKIVIERVKIPRDEAQRLRRTYGWRWNVYITMSFMLGKPGDKRLYGPVASGLALRRSKAAEDSKKAYRNVMYKHPRTLFNAVRR